MGDDLDILTSHVASKGLFNVELADCNSEDMSKWVLNMRNGVCMSGCACGYVTFLHKTGVTLNSH